jgi:hypothetical protein
MMGAREKKWTKRHMTNRIKAFKKGWMGRAVCIWRGSEVKGECNRGIVLLDRTWAQRVKVG